MYVLLTGKVNVTKELERLKEVAVAGLILSLSGRSEENHKIPQPPLPG